MHPADSLLILHFEISYLFSAQQSILIFICDGYFKEMTCSSGVCQVPWGPKDNTPVQVFL